RERHADLVELVNLLAGSGETLVYLLPCVDQVDMIESIVNHAIEQRLGHVRWQIGIDSAVVSRIAEAGVGERQHANVGNSQLSIVVVHLMLPRHEDDALGLRVFRHRPMKGKPPEALNFTEVARRHRIILKIGNDGQGPHARRSAAFWRYGSAHFKDLWRFKKGAACREILAQLGAFWEHY